MKKSIKKLLFYSLSIGMSTLLATACTDNDQAKISISSNTSPNTNKDKSGDQTGDNQKQMSNSENKDSGSNLISDSKSPEKKTMETSSPAEKNQTESMDGAKGSPSSSEPQVDQNHVDGSNTDSSHASNGAMGATGKSAEEEKSKIPTVNGAEPKQSPTESKDVGTHGTQDAQDTEQHMEQADAMPHSDDSASEVPTKKTPPSPTPPQGQSGSSTDTPGEGEVHK